MNFKQSYKIFSDLNLACVYFSGEMHIDDLIRFVDNFAVDPDFSPDMPIIWDFRDSLVSFRMEGVTEFVEYLRQHPGIQGTRFVALLTSMPQQTIIGLEYMSQAEKMPMHINVFTTLEACLKWTHDSPRHFDTVKAYFLSHQS